MNTFEGRPSFLITRYVKPDVNSMTYKEYADWYMNFCDAKVDS